MRLSGRPSPVLLKVKKEPLPLRAMAGGRAFWYIGEGISLRLPLMPFNGWPGSVWVHQGDGKK
jgi:hypothetical protein